MFQSFDDRSESGRSAERLAALRARFDDLGIDAFLVPHADEHQSEYPAPYAERLAWLSGFTGSAGFALVLADEAILFSDGRYTLQMKSQTDPEAWTTRTLPAESLQNALADRGPLRLGMDPWLHTIAGAKKLQQTVERSGGSIVRVQSNPIDAIWTDRPGAPNRPVTVHRVEHAGKLAKEKLEEAREAVREAGAASHVVTDPLSLAWLFNLRGSDAAHNPVALGWAILHAERRPTVFIDERRLSLSARAYLTQLADIAPGPEFVPALRTVSEDGPVLLDPDRAPDALREIVDGSGGKVARGTDPALLPRAVKNATELEGARRAHERDGAAMASFLCWLDHRERDTVTEIEAAQKLEACRKETAERLGEPLREIAFDTISGSGPNGAIVHYRVTSSTDRTLRSGELYLVDSGGQYADGTTDVTRTVAIGEPTEEMRRHFTLVLKGMIAISRLRFPEGIAGVHLDSFAREALWRHGLDYAHGTGHGVGSYGAVHEGPQGLSRRSREPFRPGMIVSNEPGYYREGEYGIRIENLVVVTEPERPEGGDIDVMGFETLTLCPIDARLIAHALLHEAERDWLDAYHRCVERQILPLLEGEDEKVWLRAACRPVASTDLA